jgi:hypothetical protein
VIKENGRQSPDQVDSQINVIRMPDGNMPRHRVIHERPGTGDPCFGFRRQLLAMKVFFLDRPRPIHTARANELHNLPHLIAVQPNPMRPADFDHNA